MILPGGISRDKEGEITVALAGFGFPGRDRPARPSPAYTETRP